MYGLQEVKTSKRLFSGDHSSTSSNLDYAGKRERCPLTQKFSCRPTPTRSCRTGQPDTKVQWSSLAMDPRPS
ncbi:hypothetical protein L596_007091 [Steinernema carpocapsae]|uniref:Uncharacterized protein n=1 Tax=Steinernema carpocapsae TaxID=34508 RepID=A0A4U5P885_STECR|nr:hypothetical protein L596_007091 [Steinernema carpocapsae]